ncbi:hypothetical protein FBUS_07476 [Fasciolopsis buskii]|uniref:Uncharacterized protein n=1 Tax=Fasciolopsis buskii TaxID=27845 RepID=A0A8E0S353_9TREM|nr:hypothetical protein FBUS_07476 [Fasciolopsis buski]
MFGHETNANPKSFSLDALRSDQLNDALSVIKREVEVIESNRQAARKALLAAGFLVSGTYTFWLFALVFCGIGKCCIP